MNTRVTDGTPLQLAGVRMQARHREYADHLDGCWWAEHGQSYLCDECARLDYLADRAAFEYGSLRQAAEQGQRIGAA